MTTPPEEPLELQDIQPGGFVRCGENTWFAVRGMNNGHVMLSDGSLLSRGTLLANGWEIRQPGESEWRKCAKRVPEQPEEWKTKLLRELPANFSAIPSPLTRREGNRIFLANGGFFQMPESCWAESCFYKLGEAHLGLDSGDQWFIPMSEAEFKEFSAHVLAIQPQAS